MENFDREFIFETFEEAMDVHKQLFKLLREDGFVCYGTLYIYVYKEIPYDTDDYRLYGWDNLFESKVEPYGTDGEWVLKMPELVRFIPKVPEYRNIKKESNNKNEN